MEEAKRMLGNKVIYAGDQYDALDDADALLLVTEWSEFKFPNFNIIRKLMKAPVVFDGRNIYDGKEMQNNGFTYFGIGVKTAEPI